MATSKKLPSPQENLNFNHPYTPYDVQLQFMKAAYDVLEDGDGQVGILESPTGTGKSLSLICASLTWLRNHKRAEFEASCQINHDQFKDEPDWLVEQMLKRQRDDVVKKWEEREARLKKIRLKEKLQEERGSKRRRIDEPRTKRGAKSSDDEAEWLLDEWNNNDEFSTAVDDPFAGLSKETRQLMEKVGLGGSRKLAEEDDIVDSGIKIYYTSRTHSQISQFISELRRPLFPASIPEHLLSTQGGDADAGQEGIKHIPLSSRQKLCVNPSVAKLGSLSAINDRCSELQQPKAKDKCPFVPSADNVSLTHQFRDTSLATLPDIEDLYQLGKTLQVCPYYASRTAIPGAEIITLPYPLLLQKSARDALGIRLENNIVIIDEAHNIMDAIANVHAAEIRLSELRRGRQMLGVYVKRFGKKLKGENRIMVAQVARVIDGLTQWLDNTVQSKTESGIVDSNTLLNTKGLDQLNLYKLIHYIQESKLAFKIESYISHIEEEAASTSGPRSSTPVLHNLLSFLVSLTNLSTEGRIFHEQLPGPPPDIKLSYLLLSPTHAFSSVASSARAVILAGGTMSPFEDYKAHLFPMLPDLKITTLSCGHVIPPSNLCVWTLAAPQPGGGGGGGGIEFEFSFQKRRDRAMIRQLGVALLNICSAVPDGVVVFLPSYGYLDEVVAVWQAPAGAGETQTVWDRLRARKAVFRDAKDAKSEDVLAEYSRAILGDPEADAATAPAPPSRRGAVLLSVVGGRMSEGINFSDRLGRCVVVVGLPYPNINSPEWKAKLEYIESATLSRLTSAPSTTAFPLDDNSQASRPMSREQAAAAAKQAARDFYENACMRAVNQSIGRAIRHQNDYAAIVLVDRRFGTERIRGKLPGWIRGGMVEGSEGKGVGHLMGALSGFFRGKRGT